MFILQCFTKFSICKFRINIQCDVEHRRVAIQLCYELRTQVLYKMDFGVNYASIIL